ncbi:MAG: hypothetical protein ABGY95_03220 [Rubritalea sp.]|uniref:hypothetical protein n=1 Tax=Rubritalea sp. TaxID=2109375 RepID=UPI0032420D84
MARRSRRKKSNNPAPVIIGSVAAVLVIGIGYVSLKRADAPSAKEFPLETYVDSCNSLRGNEYSISGEIVENAQHDPNVGKFIFLRVDTGDQAISQEMPQSIGIMVPSSVKGPNLETKQNYTFVVDVKKEGSLVASSYTAR